MSEKISRSKKLYVARNLPPSYHTVPSEEFKRFKIQDSEVIKWLIQRPSILDFLWDHLKQSDHVFYNPVTGKWQGVEYEEGDE